MAVLPPDPIFNLRCPEMGAVHSICFHQNERLLSGTGKGTVHLWDLQTNRSSLYFDAGSSPVISLHHSDSFLLSQQNGGTIKCWSLTNTGYVLNTILDTNHPAFCRKDFDSDKGLLILPKNKNEIGLLTVNDFKIQRTLVPNELNKWGVLSSVRMANIHEQCYILAGYESGHMLTWDLRCCKIINQELFDECLMALDYDSFTNRGISGGSTDKLFVFSYRTKSMDIERKMDITVKSPGVNCLRIRPDQKVFASAGWDGRIRIFSWKSLRLLAVLTEHKSGAVMDIAYSTDKVLMWNAPVMAAAGMDGQITLWDLYN